MNHEARNFEVTYLENEVSDKAIHQSYLNKKSLYGIDKEQFVELAEAQDNKCAACGADAEGMVHSLNIDHNHYTNEVRGLLCAGCNTAAHWLDDDADKAIKLAEYLKSHGTGVFVTGMVAKTKN